LHCRANSRNRGRPRAASFRVRAVLLAFAAAAVAGCEHATPTPPTALPVIERPVVTLKTSAPGARVLAPSAAVVERGGIPGVFVLRGAAAFPPPTPDAEGKPLPQARFRMVKTGKPVGHRIEILSGLRGNETLVLGNLADVRDGSPLMVRR
jgi:hypothetical protein